ncbi:hypothetical protein C2E23DRAFT_201772 [Lenzites betulinus]|nr:hypothetical protein C2E23DRAFT_201772 [Lenzites betulinus]
MARTPHSPPSFARTPISKCPTSCAVRTNARTHEHRYALRDAGIWGARPPRQWLAQSYRVHRPDFSALFTPPASTFATRLRPYPARPHWLPPLLPCFPIPIPIPIPAPSLVPHTPGRLAINRAQPDTAARSFFFACVRACVREIVAAGPLMPQTSPRSPLPAAVRTRTRPGQGRALDAALWPSGCGRASSVPGRCRPCRSTLDSESGAMARREGGRRGWRLEGLGGRARAARKVPRSSPRGTLCAPWGNGRMDSVRRSVSPRSVECPRLSAGIE